MVALRQVGLKRLGMLGSDGRTGVARFDGSRSEYSGGEKTKRKNTLNEEKL